MRANDATNIRATAKVSTSSMPGNVLSLPLTNGAGSFSHQFATAETLLFAPGEDWNVRIELQYTLNGEEKTETVDYTAPPEIKGLLGFTDDGISAAGPMTAKSVSGTLSFSYPADDRHSYSPEVFMVELGWAKEASGGSLFGSFEPLGKKQIWFMWDGPGPVSDPGTAVESGGRMLVPFSYSTTLDATPSAEAAAAGATHFYLIFSLGGEGTDTDGEHYGIRSPENAMSYPQPLTAPLTAPTLSFSSLRYWGEFNAPGMGVDLFELSYVLTPNDAADLTADVTLSSEVGSYSWSALTQTGTVSLRRSAGGEPFCVSSAHWTPEITLRYKLGGVDKEEVFNFGVVSVSSYAPRFELSYSGAEVTATLTTASGDPFSYTVSGVTAVELDWMEKIGESSWSWLGTTTLWPGMGAVETVSDGSVYRYILLPGELSPPADATHFSITFVTGGYTGKDENGTEYPITVSVMTNDDFHPISELTP